MRENKIDMDQKIMKKNLKQNKKTVWQGPELCECTELQVAKALTREFPTPGNDVQAGCEGM